MNNSKRNITLKKKNYRETLQIQFSVPKTRTNILKKRTYNSPLLELLNKCISINPK